MADATHPGLHASSIMVTVRVRPFTTEELSALQHDPSSPLLISSGSLHSSPAKSPTRRSNAVLNILRVVDKNMLIFDPPKTTHNNTNRMGERRFIFDRVFDMDATQEEVYNDTARPLLTSVLDGFNTTIFAYGATGCGKTHTILGGSRNPGVIYLLVSELYRRIDDTRDTMIADINVLFLEIYNETIKDLLNPATKPSLLIIRESAKKHTMVSNLLVHSPALVEEVMALIMRGNRNRTTSRTHANATSSRSHAVFQVNIIQKKRSADVDENHLLSTLSIIDLAGLERALATKNRGVLFHEGANINRLLLSLGNCINALCDPRRRNHIPYRDSKLTRLLKFSLGGNCKTVMIVCVSPLLKHRDETLNTLKYADQAKKIRTKPVRNQQSVTRHVKAYMNLISEQRQEIEELRLREKHVLKNALERRYSLQQEILGEILTLRRQMLGRVNELWQQYFILAKRKLLFSIGVQVKILVEKCSSKVRALCEQVSDLVGKQVSELEREYRKSSVFDHLLADTCDTIKQNFSNREGWDPALEQTLDLAVENASVSLKRDVIQSSSILFEHLLSRLSRFSLAGLFSETEVLQALQAIISGEFDAAVTTATNEFMSRTRAENLMHPSLTENSLHPSQGENSLHLVLEAGNDSLGDRPSLLSVDFMKDTHDISPDSSVVYTPLAKKRQMFPGIADLTSTPEHSPKRRLTLRSQWIDGVQDTSSVGRDNSLDTTLDAASNEAAPAQENLLDEIDSSFVSPPPPKADGVAKKTSEIANLYNPRLRMSHSVRRRPIREISRSLDGTGGRQSNENHEEISSSPTPACPAKLNMLACVRVTMSSDSSLSNH